MITFNELVFQVGMKVLINNAYCNHYQQEGQITESDDAHYKVFVQFDDVTGKWYHVSKLLLP